MTYEDEVDKRYRPAYYTVDDPAHPGDPRFYRRVLVPTTKPVLVQNPSPAKPESPKPNPLPSSKP